MANIINKRSSSVITTKITIELEEIEARALEAIAGYGSDPFKKWFYKNLGKYYLEPHHKGIDTLFDTINKEIRPHLHLIDEARKVMKGIIK